MDVGAHIGYYSLKAAPVVGAGGHATVVRGDKSSGAFAPVSDSLMRIHRALKTAFDPERIFNLGRLYSDL